MISERLVVKTIRNEVEKNEVWDTSKPFLFGGDKGVLLERTTGGVRARGFDATHGAEVESGFVQDLGDEPLLSGSRIQFPHLQNTRIEIRPLNVLTPVHKRLLESNDQYGDVFFAIKTDGNSVTSADPITSQYVGASHGQAVFTLTVSGENLILRWKKSGAVLRNSAGKEQVSNKGEEWNFAKSGFGSSVVQFDSVKWYLGTSPTPVEYTTVEEESFSDDTDYTLKILSLIVAFLFVVGSSTLVLTAPEKQIARAKPKIVEFELQPPKIETVVLPEKLKEPEPKKEEEIVKLKAPEPKAKFSKDESTAPSFEKPKAFVAPKPVARPAPAPVAVARPTAKPRPVAKAAPPRPAPRPIVRPQASAPRPQARVARQRIPKQISEADKILGAFADPKFENQINDIFDSKPKPANRPQQRRVFQENDRRVASANVPKQVEMKEMETRKMGGLAKPDQKAAVGYDQGAKDKARIENQGKQMVQVKTTEAYVSMGLSEAQVGLTMQKNSHRIQSCYNSALIRGAPKKGRVKVNFLINSLGRVAKINLGNSDFRDNAFHSCVLGEIKNFQFDRPDGGVSVPVTYPFDFNALR